jgi:hypothetical protein
MVGCSSKVSKFLGSGNSGKQAGKLSREIPANPKPNIHHLAHYIVGEGDL